MLFSCRKFSALLLACLLCLISLPVAAQPVANTKVPATVSEALDVLREKLKGAKTQVKTGTDNRSRVDESSYDLKTDAGGMVITQYSKTTSGMRGQEPLVSAGEAVFTIPFGRLELKDIVFEIVPPGPYADVQQLVMKQLKPRVNDRYAPVFTRELRVYLNGVRQVGMGAEPYPTHSVPLEIPDGKVLAEVQTALTQVMRLTAAPIAADPLEAQTYIRERPPLRATARKATNLSEAIAILRDKLEVEAFEEDATGDPKERSQHNYEVLDNARQLTIIWRGAGSQRDKNGRIEMEYLQQYSYVIPLFKIDFDKLDISISKRSFGKRNVNMVTMKTPREGGAVFGYEMFTKVKNIGLENPEDKVGKAPSVSKEVALQIPLHVSPDAIATALADVMRFASKSDGAR